MALQSLNSLLNIKTNSGPLSRFLFAGFADGPAVLAEVGFFALEFLRGAFGAHGVGVEELHPLGFLEGLLGGGGLFGGLSGGSGCCGFSGAGGGFLRSRAVRGRAVRGGAV